MVRYAVWPDAPTLAQATARRPAPAGDDHTHGSASAAHSVLPVPSPNDLRCGDDSAVAFGVFVYCRPYMGDLLFPSLVGTLALCVPCIWIGMAVFGYGFGALGRRAGPYRDAVCGGLVVCGFTLTYGAVVVAALLTTLLVFLLTVAFPITGSEFLRQSL